MASLPALRSLHLCEEPQLLGWKRQAPGTSQRLGAIQHERVLRSEGKQCSLSRCKAGGMEAPVSDVFDCAILQIVATVVFGSHDVVKHCAQVMPIHPQQHL